MNWAEIWPQVVAGILVAVVTGVAVYLARQLKSLRHQLGEAKSLARRLKSIGLSNFYESRDDYAKFRGASRLADYVALANRRIIVAGYWLAQGAEMEGIAADFRRLLATREGLSITIIIIDPDAEYVSAIADQMRLAPEAVIARAQDSIRGLVDLKSSLTSDMQDRLDLRTHAAIPFASLIVLDPEVETNARIQFDFKPYGCSRSDSIGFEIRSIRSRVAQTLIRSCDLMQKTSSPVDVSRFRV